MVSSEKISRCAALVTSSTARSKAASFAFEGLVKPLSFLTNWSAEQISGEELLERYRQRGTAEGHMGELMDVLDPALSSSPRQKRHYGGRPVSKHFPAGDSFAQNEVLLLLNMLAYGLVHGVRLVVESATKEGWSLRRVRERILRIAGRVLVHGRRATLVISQAASVLWRDLWPRLAALHWA